MNATRAEAAWKAYQDNHDLDDSHKDTFMAGLENYERVMMGTTDIEWGIAYVGSNLNVDPIKNVNAAKGIFGHYGLPGDKLVQRRVGPWEAIEEK